MCQNKLEKRHDQPLISTADEYIRAVKKDYDLILKDQIINFFYSSNP